MNIPNNKIHNKFWMKITKYHIGLIWASKIAWGQHLNTRSCA